MEWIYLVSLGLVILACFMGRTLITEYIKTVVKQSATAELEEYKAELKAMTLDIKYNHQRMLTDFGLFTNKKHKYYTKLYKTLLQAEGSIRSLRGVRQEPAFTDYDEQDVEEYLRKNLIPNGKIKQILQWWTSGNTKDAIAEIRRYLRIKRYRDAQRNLHKARNVFWYAQLYLSIEVKEHGKALIDALESLLINYNDDYQGLDLKEENKELIKKINVLLPLIIGTMNRELGIADYANHPIQQEDNNT